LRGKDFKSFKGYYMDKKTERTIKIAASVGGGLTAFTYLLYFVGRTYSQAYFAALNVPSGIMNYSFVDYAYTGAQWYNLVIVLLFTSVVIGLLLFQFVPSLTNSRERVPIGDKIFGFGYFVYFVLILIFSAVILLFSQLPKAIVALLSVFSLGTACWFLLILSEKKLASYIKRGKVKSRTFIVATVAIIILFPYTCSTTWGTFSGVLELDKNPHGYPLIELTSSQQLIDGIKWSNTSDNSSYKTDEQLELITSNYKYIVLKSTSQSSSVYVVKMEDILSMTVIGPPSTTRPDGVK
jgi:hypothetical protein